MATFFGGSSTLVATENDRKSKTKHQRLYRYIYQNLCSCTEVGIKDKDISKHDGRSVVKKHFLQIVRLIYETMPAAPPFFLMNLVRTLQALPRAFGMRRWWPARHGSKHRSIWGIGRLKRVSNRQWEDYWCIEWWHCMLLFVEKEKRKTQHAWFEKEKTHHHPFPETSCNLKGLPPSEFPLFPHVCQQCIAWCHHVCEQLSLPWMASHVTIYTANTLTCRNPRCKQKIECDICIFQILLESNFASSIYISIFGIKLC